MPSKYTPETLEKLSSQMPLPFLVDDYNDACFEIAQCSSRKERDKAVMEHKVITHELEHKVETNNLHEASGLFSKQIVVPVNEDYSVIAVEKIRSNFGKKRYTEWISVKEANQRHASYEFRYDVGQVKSQFVDSLQELNADELRELIISERQSKYDMLQSLVQECQEELSKSVEYTKYWDTHPIQNNS